jgi:hypothetical protein
MAIEPLQRQAAQLAEYLQGRQRELDHREARQNAELAQLESDVRTARMWLSEQEDDIVRRRTASDVREKELLARLQRLAAAEAVLRRKAGSASSLANYSDREETIRQAAADLKRRQREWEAAENRLASAQAETEKLHEQLSAERAALREEIRVERRRLVELERQAAAELGKKRELLERRGEQMDQGRAALKQLRGELQQLHRETLEIRLATEELWTQLSGSATPAAMTRSLGRIRSQLADQYRVANAELLERKKELETIRDQLVEQYEKLVEQKRQFDQWRIDRQAESEQQAAELSAREREIKDRQSLFDNHERRWQLDRLEYEQEIRRLRLELDRRGEK